MSSQLWKCLIESNKRSWKWKLAFEIYVYDGKYVQNRACFGSVPSTMQSSGKSGSERVLKKEREYARLSVCSAFITTCVWAFCYDVNRFSLTGRGDPQLWWRGPRKSLLLLLLLDVRSAWARTGFPPWKPSRAFHFIRSFVMAMR